MIPPSGLPEDLRDLDRTLVMGIVNVTPDSFSDGGRWADTESAIKRGLLLHGEGADLVDVGGESTRPGAQRITPEEELARVLPVVTELAHAGVHVSIDTMRAYVAQECVDAGAILVNDVSGGQADPDMLAWLCTGSVPYVAMHWRGPSDVMEDLATYADVVSEVRAELGARLEAIGEAGVALERVVLDPGLGFAKRSHHNWEILRGLESLKALGRTLLVGASRKRFLGDLLADGSGLPRPLEQRDAAGDAVTALAAAQDVWCVRVHEVRASRDAVMVAQAWKGGP